MNNKGMTLVELIITFALVLVMVVGLYNLVLEVKFQLDDKQDAKDLNQYSSVLGDDIHYKLLSNRKKITEISMKSVSYSGNPCIKNDSGDNCSKSSLMLKNLCGKIKECLVYCYDKSSSSGEVSNKCEVVGLNANSFEGPLANYGIYHGEASTDKAVYEPLPIANKYIIPQYGTAGLDVSVESDTKIYINYDEKYLIINYPLFLINDTGFSHNYGFKIAVPIK